MPGGNRTGPTGMGPITGRGAGFCAGYPVPGYMNPGGGYFGRSAYSPMGAYGYGYPYLNYRGFVGGFGRGRGRVGGRFSRRRIW